MLQNIEHSIKHFNNNIMEAQAQIDNQFSKLRDMIEHIKIAMLTTLDEKGNLISRPMAAQKVDNEGVIWFFTKKNSPKANELQKDERVNLSFSNLDKQLYVSVSGAAREDADRTKIDALWNPELDKLFPYGKDDPNLTLLRVEIHLGEYWDGANNKMIQLFNIVSTLTSENSFQPSENETISLDQAHNDPNLLTVPFKIDSF